MNLTPSISEATLTKVYWAGPIGGGIVAAVFYNFVMRAPHSPESFARSGVPLGPEDPAQEAILNHGGQEKEVIADRTTSI